MSEYNIYQDIADRTGGDIYIGVVGPVRTGKSTFIKRFMEELVIGNIDDKSKAQRARDELPQSADGKTVMTTEPKFVPNEAVSLDSDGVKANVRMIDCVGYMVEGALGADEDGKPRMVKTPWDDKEMPFEVSAEIGTEKVIREHSTVGVVVTTDGSITGLPRASYLTAEERVVRELKDIGKPFVVILNTSSPESEESIRLAESLQERYGVSVTAMDILNASGNELGKVLEKAVMEFPLKRIDIKLPKWVCALGRDSELMCWLKDKLISSTDGVKKMSDYAKVSGAFGENDYIESDPDIVVDSAVGAVSVDCRTKDGLFYKTLERECGEPIDDDYKLLSYIIKVGRAYNKYEKIRVAMDSVMESGYGVVIPGMEEMSLAEPELTKKGTQFGVRLKASAPSIHMMRVDVETEVKPIIGSEQQSEDLVNYLMSEFENDKQGIWNTNMFGKPLSSLVKDDLDAKISNMPSTAQRKLRRTVTRIVNEGKGGVLCILL